jgi:hypothetical protein
MDNHTATETAYRNGYAEGFAAAKAAAVPCNIGDMVFVLKPYADQYLLKSGRVSQMYYDDERMNLVICVKHIMRGLWGRDVFATEAEAREAAATRGKRSR